MSFLSDTATLTALPDGTYWLVAEPLTYIGRTQQWTIPAGMITDLASVPLSLTWLAPRYGTYTRAALLHDYLCREARRQHLTHADADGVLRRVLRELGVSAPRRWLMWSAVRLGSHLTGASAGEVAQVVGVALLGVPFLAVPTALVWTFQHLFALIDRSPRAAWPSPGQERS